MRYSRIGSARAPRRLDGRFRRSRIPFISLTIPHVDRSAQLAASDAVPFSRLAWIAGALGTAAQPHRLVVGFVIALLLWVPGLAWDASVGASIDPPGLLAEPWDDTEQDDAQRTLRRLAVQHVPDSNFEGARIPAADLAAALFIRADELGSDPQAERVAAAARRAASLVPLGNFQALAAAEADACAAIIDGALALDVRPIAAGFRATVIDIPAACAVRSTAFAGVFGAWALLVLAVGGGALARMEAVQISGRGLIRPGAAVAYAVERWSTFLLSWVAPVAIAAVVGIACIAWGFLFRSNFGGWIGASLYIVPLFVGAIAGIALLIAALGTFHAPSAIACDGLSALDASQRGAIYFLARPKLWTIVLGTSLAVVTVGFAILRIIGWAITAFPAAMVELGADGAAPVHALAIAPQHRAIPLDGRSLFIWAWVLLIAIAVAGAAISLIVGTFTRGYLLLREACDGQPTDAVWPFETPLDVSEVPPAARRNA